MQQADRDGLHVLGTERRDGRARPGRVQGPQDAAVGQDALVDLDPKLARHQRDRRIDEEVVHVVATLPPDLDGVPEPGGGEEPDAGALSLDQGIGRQGGSVDEGAHRGRSRPRLVQQGDHAFLDRLGGVLGSRQQLADPDRAGDLVDPDEVGEGAADVHPDARGVATRCHQITSCRRELRPRSWPDRSC